MWHACKAGLMAGVIHYDRPLPVMAYLLLAIRQDVRNAVIVWRAVSIGMFIVGGATRLATSSSPSASWGLERTAPQPIFSPNTSQQQHLYERLTFVSTPTLPPINLAMPPHYNLPSPTSEEVCLAQSSSTQTTGLYENDPLP